MKSFVPILILAWGALVGVAAGAPSAQRAGPVRLAGIPEPAAAPLEALGQADAYGWIVRKEDHIAGISDPRHMSNPASIRYQDCLEATAAWKEMKSRRIDPDSIEGRALRKRAATQVTKACEEVRKASGYCSIWKEVRHKDGRQIADASSAVIALL